MKHFRFSTKDFAVSDHGVHLLISNFNYKTINYKDITSLDIGLGKLMRNWGMVCAIGICLIVFSIYFPFLLADNLHNADSKEVYIEELLVPVLTGSLGVLCIYFSSRRGVIMKISYNGKKTKVSLEEIIRNNLYDEFLDYLVYTAQVYSKLKAVRNPKELTPVE